MKNIKILLSLSLSLTIGLYSNLAQSNDFIKVGGFESLPAENLVEWIIDDYNLNYSMDLSSGKPITYFCFSSKKLENDRYCIIVNTPPNIVEMKNKNENSKKEPSEIKIDPNSAQNI